MRLDRDAGKPRCLWPNSGDDREKVKIRMSAPSMRIRPRGLRLFCPSCKSPCNHVPPRFQQIQIAVSQACVIQGSRQLEPEVVGCLCHIRQRPGECETRITGRENLRQNIFLLFRGDYVKPYAEDIGMLAVVLLGRSIRK